MPWTPDQVGLLGTDTDERVAARLGLSKSGVARKRASLGIPAFARSHWTPEAEARLGREPARRIASDLGITPEAVHRRRARLGIPPAPRQRQPAPPSVAARMARRRRHFEPAQRRRVQRAGAESGVGVSVIARENHAPRKLDWPEHLVRLLGTRPDVEVARRAGVHASTVAAERARRGIAPFLERRGRIEWTEEMIARLGEGSDREVAAELGIATRSVTYKRVGLGIPPAHEPVRPRGGSFWTRARVALLGKHSDGELARRWGISPTTVAYRRRMLGIPPLRPWKRIEWTDEMRAVLGREPDLAVAKRLGIGLRAVRAERQRLGLPPTVPLRRKIVRSPRLRSVLTGPTREIAAAGGVSVKAIHSLRAELAVPPPPRSTHWTADALAKLGQVPDQALADELGLAVATVSEKRRVRGMLKRKVSRWTPEEDALVRSLPPVEAAARTGRTLKAVRHRRRDLGLPTSRGGRSRGGRSG